MPSVEVDRIQGRIFVLFADNKKQCDNDRVGAKTSVPLSLKTQPWERALSRGHAVFVNWSYYRCFG